MEFTNLNFRKGILKKNLEGEASECDKMRLLGSQTDLILNPPGMTILVSQILFWNLYNLRSYQKPSSVFPSSYIRLNI